MHCSPVAKVGSKADPETKDIEQYKIGNLTLWDTPGLGDGTEVDEHHKELITELLREKDEEGNALIDLVLVILDGSTRDLGTSYKILNEVIIPELGGENERIKEDSNLEIEPIYYCAGYEEETGDVVRPYNLSKLLYYIMNAIPANKRVAVMEGVNTKSENYECNDDEADYNEGVKESFYDSFDYISEGVDSGAELGGAILGIPGAIIGAVLGGFVGCVRSVLEEIFM